MATLNYQLDRTKNKNGKYTVRLIVRNWKIQCKLPPKPKAILPP